MNAVFLRRTILPGLLAAIAAPALLRADPAMTRPQRTERAIAQAADFLLKTIDANGMCRHEFPQGNSRYGGRTALVAWTAALAGVSPQRNEALLRAKRWLAEAELEGTYPVATRVMAMAETKRRDREVTKLMQRDLRWLWGAMGKSGQYTYTPLDGEEGDRYDNSNAQMALMAVDAAARAGLEVPNAYWKQARSWWLAQQQPDGGWAYRQPKNLLRVRSYGSMTAAGLASLMACNAWLDDENVVRCRETKVDEPIDSAMKWLTKNYTLRRNPGKGVEWYYYWLFSLQRVGMATGHKRIGTHDWYTEGSEELLSRQRSDGSWGVGNRVEETAFAALFLLRGHRPTLVNKLQWPGRWNTRPRDAANFTDWATNRFELHMNWQIVGLDANDTDWREAPVLYLSGAGPIELKPKHLARLRRYVLRGGMIVSEAACNNGDFTVDMQKLYGKILPEFPLQRMDEGSPIREAVFELKDFGGLAATNGVRTLAVHLPRQVSLDLHRKNALLAGRISFEVLGNACMAACDLRIADMPQREPWPEAEKFQPRRTIRIARVRHAANWNPEPLAMERLATYMGRSHRIKLEAKTVNLADLDPANHPLATMTGSGKLRLSEAQSKALGRYIQAGGTLVIDAAGGDETFAKSVEEDILPLLPNGWLSRIPSKHKLYADGPETVTKVRYRRATIRRLQEQSTQPRVKMLQVGERIAVYYSREDLTAGLVGYAHYGVDGYQPASARAVYTNVLHHAATAEIASTVIQGQ
ncbi:MAG: DUF4159 domain-containing protein [Phycisphaerae bacterium]